MDVKRVAGVAATIVTVSFQAGCSFMFVKGPPSNHADLASFECSDSQAWPVFDAIWAGLNGLGAVTAGANTNTSTTGGTNTGPSQDEVVAVGVTWLVVSGVSAIYGFSKVAECRDAKQHRELGPTDGPSPMASRQCQAERYRALLEARKEPNQLERVRMINAAPVCGPPGARTAGPTMPAPGPAPAPVAAPAPVIVPEPAVPAERAPPAQPPTSSRWPSRLPDRDLRSVHTRSLAMRPAISTD